MDQERTHAAVPEQEEVAVLEAVGGRADHQIDFFADWSIAVGEAIAHEGPNAAVHAPAQPAGQAAAVDHLAAWPGPPVFDDYDVAGAVQRNFNANVNVDVHQAVGVDNGMQEEPSFDLDSYYQELHAAAADLQNFAAAQAQLNSFVVDHRAAGRANDNNNQPQAAPAKGNNNQPQAAPAKGNNDLQPHAGTAAAGAAGGTGRRPWVPQPQEERGTATGRLLSIIRDTDTSRGSSAQGITHRRRQQQPVGGCDREAIKATSSRTVPGKEDIIWARQAMLADAAHSPVFLAGIEEEAEPDGNTWYDSILHEAQALEEAMEDDELVVPFQRPQFPTPEEEEDSPPTRLRVVHSPYSDLELDDDNDEAGAGAGPSTTTQTRPRVLPLADDAVPKFDCGICMETLPILDLFHGMQCQHRFCVECMATYIEGRINAGEVPIPCPDQACPEAYGEDVAVLHPEVCKKSIDFAAFRSWGDRLTERAIAPSLRAYCPNPQCGVLLEATGGKTPARASCPVCFHPMCATCGFDWSHEDAADGSSQHDCDEGPNAQLVKKLAEERRWKQCPRCKMLVEKTYGCNVMNCRCKFVFCYGCGLPRRQQGGMEQGAELCRCQQDPFDAVFGNFQFLIQHE